MEIARQERPAEKSNSNREVNSVQLLTVEPKKLWIKKIGVRVDQIGLRTLRRRRA